MTEYATIKLKVLRAPDGDITCRTENEYCKFYRTIRWGQSEICNYTDKLIERKANAKGVPGMGYTECTEGCPMKDKE